MQLRKESLVFLIFLLIQEVSAQTQPLVSSIEVKGNIKVSQEKIISQIRTRPGQPYNENIINDDIKKLYSLGYFENISVETEKEDGKVKVIFELKEKPVLKKIIVKGNRRIRTSQILKEAELKEGSFLEEFKLREAAEKIKDFYQRRGFLEARVDFKIEKLKENEVQVIFNIQERSRLRIKQISIIGNSAFSDKRILKLIKTRPAWLFRSGFFKEKEFKDDLGRIKDFYRNQGFSDVKVDYELEKDEKRGLIYLTIKIEEGKRYLLGEITIKGNQNISTEKILSVLTLERGDIYSEENIQKDLASIQELYFDEGYIFSQIKPVTFVDLQTGLVNLSYEIQENNLVYVRMIEIKGNTKTKDKVIRRELAIRPGERLEGKKLRRSKEKLQNLGFFEKIKFDTEPTENPNEQDLIVEVKEAKTGSFSFGGGYSSVDEFIGFVELRQRNFDYKNFPTFTGAGQDLSLRLQTGTTTEEYMISFTNPWIFDRPVSFGFDGYKRSHQRETDVGYGYDQTRRGGRLRLGRRFSDYLSLGLSYRWENVEIRDVSSEATSELKKEEGKNNISGLSFSLNYDTRDNVFSPSRGIILANSLEGAGGPFGGDKDFFKIYSRFSIFFPLWRGSVLELRVRGGIISEYGDSEDVPIYERFFAGGASTIRGYHERKVGPIDPVSEDPIGGEALFVGNIEYTYPLGNYIKIAGFFDSGNVWSESSDFLRGSLKSSIGLGLRVKTPLGPVSVDYGYPLNKEPGEEKKEGRFHFSVSRGF